MQSRPTNTVELSHKYIFTNLNDQKPEFNARLFNESAKYKPTLV